MNIQIDITSRLKQIREERKLTQTQVANAIGLEVKTYQTYENGRAKPSIQTLLNLAALYGMYSVDEVLGIAGKRQVVNDEICQAYNKADPEMRKIVDFILDLNR